MSTLGGGVGIQPESSPASELKAALARKSLRPTSEWLETFLTTQRLATPAAALASTAAFRLLAGDITTALASAPALPADIHDVTIKERRLAPGDVVVQILDVEDLGRSRWEQIEAIEALERGEGIRGRQLIRVGVTEENGQQTISTLNSPTAITSAANTSKGPHKVLLQDAASTVVYGLETSPIEGINLGMSMGAKLVLKGCSTARGVVLLDPSTVTWLGGKIESLHQSWITGKKRRLLSAINGQHGNADNL